MRLTDYLSEGLVLDAGCGDGKNALYLEQRGFSVRGFDRSQVALHGLGNRFRQIRRPVRGIYHLLDARSFHSGRQFNALISYGLYHCLPVTERVAIHQTLQQAVLPGGIVAFTCLTNSIPLPTGHQTPAVSLASVDEVRHLFDGWTMRHFEVGKIREHHKPTIGLHMHSAVWLIAQRSHI